MIRRGEALPLPFKFQFIVPFIVQHCRGRRLRRPEKTLQNLDKRDVQGAVPYKLRFNYL